MFTNEFEFDRTVTTLLDETGQESDVIITIEHDGHVFIEQYDSDDDNTLNMISIPANMFRELISAFNLPEGAYRYE